MIAPLTNRIRLFLPSLLSGIFAAGLLHAQPLIDVDFNNNNYGGASGGPNPGPTMSGAAVLGASGDQWNGIDAASGSGASLFYVDGSASPVTMTFTSGGGYDVYSFSGSTPFNGTAYDALMQDYLFTGGSFKSISLSGLAADSSYDVVLYNAADTTAVGRETLFTINAYTQVSVWDGSSSTLTAGVNYVFFTSTSSDSLGDLLIYYNGIGTAEGDVDGFQIRPTPPPTPTVSITAPAAGTVYLAPANLTITADAAVSSGTVTNVQFFTNNVLLGSAATAPFTFAASNLAAGPYALTAVATADGVSATSSVVNVTVVNLSYLPKANNDNFNDAISLGDATLAGYNFTATSESGEPHSPYTNTVWWSWTAPNSGLACVAADGSSFDCDIGVYTGNNLSNLDLVADTSDKSSANTPNYLMFPVVGGTNYFFQVSGGYDLPGSYIFISVQPEGISLSDVQTNLDTNSGNTDFSASVEVANSGTSPQTIELDLVARAGFSWTQDASSNGITFYLEDGLPADQVLGSYFITNLPPGAQTNLSISNVCPAPDVIDSENFGVGWDIFVNFKGLFQDSVFLCSGPWPDIGGFNGPGGGVARVDPSGSGGSPFQLVSASILGPTNVPANSSTNFSVTVKLSNGKTTTSTNFISTVWTATPSSPFSINSDGVFSSGTVASNTLVKITATYFFAGTDYTISTNVTVMAPLVPVITWDNPADIVYGALLGGAQLNATAANPTNPALSVSGTFTYTPPLGTILAVGSNQTLSVSFTPDNASYGVVSNSVEINVQKAALTITANNAGKTYGQTTNFAGTEFTTGGLVNGDQVTSATLVSSGAPATAPVGGSPYNIVPGAALPSSLTNKYIITYQNGQLTVNPASLTITANSRAKVYGQMVSFAGTEFTTSTLFNGDTVTNVNLRSDGMMALASTAGSPYDIVPSAAMGLGLGNYTIGYVDGSLTVSRAPLTVTAINLTKIYGQALTFAGTEFTASGLRNGDKVLVATLNSSGAPDTAQVAGSPFTITPSAAVGTGLGNYTITYANGALTITAAPLTITAKNQSKTYGQTASFIGNEFTTSGLLNSDGVNSAMLTSSGAAASASIAGSPFNIVPSAAVGVGLANYSITYANGALTVNPAALTITATAEGKTYGQTVNYGAGNPNFKSVGLLNSETIGSVTMAVSGNGGATTATVGGSPYMLTPSAATGGTFVAGNYNITYVAGNLNVAPAALTVTATAEGKTYGQTVNYGAGNPNFRSVGLLNSETIGSVTMAVSGNGGAPTATVGGSPYTLTPSAATGGTFAAGNYNITYLTGNLNVAPAALTVTATAEGKTYGQTVHYGAGNPNFRSVGLLNSETIGSVTMAVSGNGGAATATVGGSPYTLTPSAATGGTFAAGNYNITYVTGNLNVAPAALTVTATAEGKTYGQTVNYGAGNPNFRSVGLLNSETIGSVTMAVSGNGGAATATVGGSPYTLTPSAATGGTFAAGNYNITYVTGSLFLSPAALTITATSQTKEVNQSFSFTGHEFTSSGLQNSESVGSVTLASSGAAAGATAGFYPIIPSAATGGTFTPGNYTITYQNGTMTVSGAPTLQFSAQKNMLIFSWPTNAVGFYLQTTTNLWSPGSWVLVPGVVVIGDQNVVTNPMTGACGYFSLKK